MVIQRFRIEVATRGHILENLSLAISSVTSPQLHKASISQIWDRTHTPSYSAHMFPSSSRACRLAQRVESTTCQFSSRGRRVPGLSRKNTHCTKIKLVSRRDNRIGHLGLVEEKSDLSVQCTERTNLDKVNFADSSFIFLQYSLFDGNFYRT